MRLRTLQEDYNKLQKSFESEKARLARLMQTYNTEKDALTIKLDNEKRKEIENINMIKDAKIQTLEGNVNNLQKTIDKLQKERDDEIDTLSTTYKNTLTMKEADLQKMKDRFKRNFEDHTKSLEAQIDIANRQTETAVLESSRKIQDKLKQEQNQRSKIVEGLKIAHNSEIKELQTQLDTYRGEIEYQRKHSTDLLKVKEQDMINQFQNIVNKLEADKIALKQAHERGYEKDITPRDNRIAFLQQQIKDMEEELTRVRGESKTVKQESETLKNNLTATMNTYRLEADKNILDKDKLINKLETELKYIQSDVTGIKEKAELHVDASKTSLELERVRCREKDKRIGELEKMYEKSESNNKIITHSYTKKIERMKQDFDGACNKYKTQVYEDFKKEKAQLENEVEKLKQFIQIFKKKSEEDVVRERNRVEGELNLKIIDLQNVVNDRIKDISYLQKDFRRREDEIRAEVKKDLENEKIKLQPPPNYNFEIQWRDEKLNRLKFEMSKIQKTSEDRIEKLTRDHDKLKENNLELEKKLAVPSAFEQRCKDISVELTAVREESIRKLNKQREDCEYKLTEAEKRYAKQEQEIADTRKLLRKEQEDFVNKLNNNPREVKLKEEIERLGETNKSLSDKVNKYDEYIKRLNDTIVSNNKKYTDSVKNMKSNEPELESRIQTLLGEIEERDRRDKEKDKELSSIKDKIDHVKIIAREEIQKSNDLCIKLERDLDHLKKNPPNRKEMDEQYKETRNKWLEDLKGIKSELESYKSRYSKASEDLDKYRTTLKEVENKLKEVESRYDLDINRMKENKDLIINERDNTINRLEKRVSELETLLKDTVIKNNS